MIVPPRPTDGLRQRTVATTATVVLLVGIYAGLRATTVPAFGSANALIRRLDPLFVERYTAPPPEAEPEAADADERPGPEATAGSAAMAQEVSSAIDELTRRFGAGGSRVTAGGGRMESQADVGTRIAADPGGDRFSALFGSGGADPLPPAAPRVRTPPTASPSGSGIEMGATVRRSRSTATAGEEPEGIAAPTAASTARSAAGDGVTDVVIKTYEAERLNTDEVDALAGWMRGHAADLPAAVKVHLRYLPAFLTAEVPVVSGDRRLDFFLMYNESLRELHILMVEGDRSVYLIDRGFQARTRSLREGQVRRLNGEIVAVDSQQRAASSQQAQEFYNIFLSWWEVARTTAAR